MKALFRVIVLLVLVFPSSGMSVTAPSRAAHGVISVAGCSDGWEVFSRNGLNILSLKRKLLLVPPELRCREVDSHEFVRLVAQRNGLHVWWSDGDAGAVLYRKAPETDVQMVLRELASPDEKVRLHGAWSARWVEDVRILEPLVAAHGGGASVSAQVATSARDLGLEAVALVVGEKALPLLEQSLGHRDAPVRSDAARAVGQIRGEKSLKLLEKCLSDKDPDVRAVVADSLGRLGGGQAVALLKKMINDDKDGSVREAAARSLGRVASDGALDALRDVFEKGRPVARRAAVSGLGHADGIGTLQLLRKALNDDDPWARRSAVLAVGQLDDDNALSILEMASKSEDGWMRRNAVEGLGQKKGEAAFALLQSLFGDNDSYVRRSVILAVRNTCGGKTMALLEQAQQDENVWVRREAALALGEAGGDKAVQLLEKALRDDPIVRGGAISALGRIGNEMSLALLEKHAKGTDDITLSSIVIALVDAAGEKKLRFLQAGFNDPSFKVRQGALSVADRIPAPKIIPLLDRMVDDKMWFVRQHVAEILGKVGTEKVLDSLGKLLNDEAPDGELSGRIRLAAASALMRVGGERAKDILVARLPRESNIYVRDKILKTLTDLYSYDARVKDLLKKPSQPK